MAIQTDNNGEGQNIVTSCDCPLTRVAESSTITINILGATNTTDTYSAFIVAKKEPILTKVEN